MQGWVRDGALWLGLSAALSCLAMACAASPDSSTQPRTSQGGDSAGGASDAGTGGDGGDSAGAAGQAPEPIPLAEVARPMLEAQCERLTRCGQAIQYEQVPGGCVAAQLAEWEAAFDGIRDEIEQGRVVYDPAAAPACIEARRTARCDGPVFPDACAAAIDGTRDVGEPCEQGVECVGGSFCEGCPGKCTPGAKLEEACGDGQWCESGLRCAEGRCVALRLEGESCDFEGAWCASGDVCLDYTAETDGVCQSVRAAKLGEECGWERGLFCETGSACVESERNEGGTRQMCIKRSRSGGTCWRGIQDSCPAGEYCPISSEPLTAKCRPLSQAGERCPESNACAPGSRCLFGGLCVEPRALGEACNEGDECSSWFCVQGVCALDARCAVAGGNSRAPVLHDPPPPAEHCPTEASAGELLQGFDNRESIDGWSTSSTGTAEAFFEWSMAERFSCSGALHLHASFSAAGQDVYVMIPSPMGSFWDWSQKKRLHVAARLAPPGVGDHAQLLEVRSAVSSRSTDLQTVNVSLGDAVDASWLRDFAWHELVFDLHGPDPERIEKYGISLRVPESLPDGAPKELPEIDLYVDDFWLE